MKKKETPIDPKGYTQLLADLKTRIQQAQVRAGLHVNRELVTLYWNIGNEILRRQKRLGWGAKVIDRLSFDLRRSFPDMKGFSSRNIKYMRALAEAYPNVAFVQQAVAQLPWGQNVRILDHVKSRVEREWYIRATIQHGWSRDVLVHQIEAKAIHRYGKALSNFDQTLPKPQSDLARQILKDPYNFDFLTLGPDAVERDLEVGLLPDRSTFHWNHPL
jgi:predicted nuclease of restriction endonuclease-like (RecB) superfamily